MEEAAKKTEETPKKEEKAAVKARPTNCAKCNKPLKKKIWYYRNGKHYCTKTCWRASLASTVSAQKETTAAAT